MVIVEKLGFIKTLLPLVSKLIVKPFILWDNGSYFKPISSIDLL